MPPVTSEAPTPAAPPVLGTAAPAATGRHGFGFQPGLEGLRGVAVVAVLLFHAGFDWARGGFLGVSTFFTLSGFLITTLLLGEHQRNGRVSLRAFWARRFRRLMPAALACLAGVLVFAATVATPGQLGSLRGDMLAALFYVANWRFIAVDASYAELFTAPSPVLHFWSLAIEEQFYLLLPLVVVGLLAARRRRVVLGVLAAGALASFVYCAHLAGQSLDAAYYNTFSRAGELLAGALLAVVALSPRSERVLGSSWGRRWVAVLGAAALALCVLAWSRVEQTELWLYRGGLATYALLTVVVVVAAMSAGPVRGVLSTAPLRWMGRISYGVYLYHWPIFLWLTPLRTGLSTWPLFGLRMAVTLAAAVVSYHLIEQPIRSGRFLTGGRAVVVAPVAVAVLVVGIVRIAEPPAARDLVSFTPTVAEPEVPVFDPSEIVDAPPPTVPEPDLSGYPAPPAPPLPPQPALAPGESPRIYLTGDSAAYTVGIGLAEWGTHHGTALVWNAGWFGCGVGQGGLRTHVGQLDPPEYDCTQIPPRWFGDMAELRPHLSVLMVGVWDVADRLLEGDDVWRSLGDPVYDQYLRRELTNAVDVLQSQGSSVALLTHPPIRTGLVEQLPNQFPESDPARMERLNELLVEVAATRERVTVVDLATYMASRPGGALDLVERPDGIHWTPNTSRPLADWLGPQLVAVARGEPLPPGVERTSP